MTKKISLLEKQNDRNKKNECVNSTTFLFKRNAVYGIAEVYLNGFYYLMSCFYCLFPIVIFSIINYVHRSGSVKKPGCDRPVFGVLCVGTVGK